MITIDNAETWWRHEDRGGVASLSSTCCLHSIQKWASPLKAIQPPLLILNRVCRKRLNSTSWCKTAFGEKKCKIIIGSQKSHLVLLPKKPTSFGLHQCILHHNVEQLRRRSFFILPHPFCRNSAHRRARVPKLSLLFKRIALNAHREKPPARLCCWSTPRQYDEKKEHDANLVLSSLPS